MLPILNPPPSSLPIPSLWAEGSGAGGVQTAKAFDCVDHNKLWKILKDMAMGGGGRRVQDGEHMYT